MYTDPKRQAEWYQDNKKTEMMEIEKVIFSIHQFNPKVSTESYTFVANGQRYEYWLETALGGGCKIYYDVEKDKKLWVEIDYIPKEAYGWQRNAHRRINIAFRIHLHSTKDIE
jgi:uncharacterized protein YwgA